MPYYLAGDFYRAGGGNYYRAGGILGTLFGAVTRTVGSLGIPGVSAVANIIAPEQRPRGQAAAVTTPATLATAGVTQVGGKPAIRQKEPGITGAVHRLMPGGHSGYLPGRRHMNPGNAKAARRAIRRITSVRKMLHSIERQLPHRVVHAKARRGR